MQTFDWTSFTKKIAIKASLAELYDAWTKASDIQKWFLSKAVYFDENNQPIPPVENTQAGYRYEWNWYAQDYLESGRILQANGKDFVQFSFAGPCTVDVQLTEQDDLVIVALTQKDIPADEQSKQNIRLGCASGWSFFMVNLKSVYEGGLDLRNKEAAFTSMINN